MGGAGIEQRLAILRGSVDQQIVKPFRTHGWIADISQVVEEGEYIVITATKLGVTKRVALLYSSATDNRIYKTLDVEVDRTFTNGELYKPESFAYGLSKPVTPVDEFYPVLVAWNKELFPAVSPAKAVKPQPSSVKRIKAENPLASVWARLEQFTSTHLAEKLISRRASLEGVNISPAVTKSKGEGVAFSLRNAAEYYRSAQNESLNRKILSLYYGTLALAFAEILSSPVGPADLDEIEGYTKYGHGLYTLGTALRGFSAMGVGVLATGFLPRWAEFLGHDVSGFPPSRAKADDAVPKLPKGTFCTVRDLFSSLPEVADLFAEVFESEPSWIYPVFDSEATGQPSFKPQQKTGSSYIKLIDRSGRIQQERIEMAGWPLAEMSRLADQTEGNVFRARVDHPGMTYWFEALPVHHSAFENSGSLLIPPLADLNEYRVIAFCLLYALSIMVRYMPSTWRRVEGGDLDQFLSIVRTSLSVFERSLPQEFLETITGERIIAVQPGSLLG
jgi:hypothetical protein